MSLEAPGLEGELIVQLRLAQGRVAQVQIRSSRPAVAQRLLSGRSRAQAQAAVPLLFSVCGHSQAAACALACAAAADEPSLEATVASARAAVAAEMRREAAWSCLLHWPARLGESPSADALGAARLAGAAVPSAPVAQGISQAVFGQGAADFLALAQDTDLSRLQSWAERGPTAAARYLQQALQQASTAHSAAVAALLPLQHDAPQMRSLARTIVEQPDFDRQPHWLGVAAETGALARQQHQPLVEALLAAPLPAGAARLPARLLARLLELARLLLPEPESALHARALGALPLPGGHGLAWVENARGLLLHRVQLEGAGSGARVRDYRIVAPTEWNFHPLGALPLALANAPADDRAALLEYGTRLIHSLDPCVACRVEFDDA